MITTNIKDLKLNELELDRVRKKIKILFDEDFLKLKKIYEEFLESDGKSQNEFEYLIKEILTFAWDKNEPDTFLSCYVTDEDTYKSPICIISKNLYHAFMNMQNGSTRQFVESQRLSDYYLFKENENTPKNEKVTYKRKELIRALFVSAFGGTDEEIKSIDCYKDLHVWLTRDIVKFSLMLVRSKM